MTQEDKELLLKDLCTRLPYGTICQIEDEFRINDSKFYDSTLSERHIELFRNHKGFYIKPYLCPMSSMTEEEKEEYEHIAPGIEVENGVRIPNVNQIEWLNKHHFDYRGLIEKGLALEAHDGMYER